MAERVLCKREQQPVRPPLPSRCKPKPAPVQPDAPIAPVQVAPKLKAPRAPTPVEPGAPVEAPPKPKAPRAPAPMQPDAPIAPVESDGRAGLAAPISSTPVEKASSSNPRAPVVIPRHRTPKGHEEAAAAAGWQAYNDEVLPPPRRSLGAMLGLADNPQLRASFGPRVTGDVVRRRLGLAPAAANVSLVPPRVPPPRASPPRALRRFLLEAVEVPTLTDVYGASISDPVMRTPKSPIHAAPQKPVSVSRTVTSDPVGSRQSLIAITEPRCSDGPDT
ncbi:hypothetical protein B0H17DRAFT_1204493 [Mycena rosella]|uniref:Uncharacterized protein n=1 Tax=Mycena rosella TaxID=1033263 RepID=A0AAD7GB65_MYCRO|nr:hypothetical protein B0H17DRAFT_1204493 [Mycena rosella]